MMKVLVSDVLGEAGIKMFQDEPGIEVDVNTGLEPEALKGIIGEYDGLVIRSATKVTEEILEAAGALKVVGRAGIGLDNVDIPAATKRGVVVMNTPTGNVVTTAEHTIAMMMALTRNIPWGTSTLKDGLWEKKKLQGREVYKKVLGVVGFGKIGSIVADLARDVLDDADMRGNLDGPKTEYHWIVCTDRPRCNDFVADDTWEESLVTDFLVVLARAPVPITDPPQEPVPAGPEP